MITTRTLADWIGPGHAPAYNLDAAADALDDAGITDLDADPAHTMTILADHEKPAEPSEGEAFARLLWDLAADGGTRGPLTVTPAEPRTDHRRHPRVTVGDWQGWVWLLGPDTVTDDTETIRDMVETAESAAEADEQDLAAALHATQRDVAAAQRVMDQALAARRDAVRAWVRSGRSAYAAAQRLGVSQTLVRRMLS